ncbi:MAG TPA: glycosyltransferase family 39 protein [bacterium]|jgi:hypothetical protein
MVDDSSGSTAASLVKYLAGSLAAAYILIYVVVAILRISYPFELEWVEGSMVDHVQRVLDGKPLYVAPSVDFVPAIYPPFYYVVSAGVAKVTGLGFLPLRLVSLLSSLGCLALLFFWVRRETRSRFAGLLAAGLFAATYRLGGAWLDLGRVDSLFLLLLLGALYLLRFHRTRVGFGLAAVLLFFSALTKQTALLAALPLLWLAIRQRKQGGLTFVAVFVLLTGFAAAALQITSDGWFSFYALDVPAGHNIIPGRIADFVLGDLLRPFMVACLCGVVYLIMQAGKAAREELWFYLFSGAGVLLASWVPRIKDGNFANDVIPAWAFLALLCGVAVPALRTAGQKVLAALPEDFPARARLARWGLPLFYGALVLQLATLYYLPQEIIPTAADRAAGYTLLKSIQQFPGEVWVAHHGYLATQAGKRPYATALPIYDVLRAKNEHAKQVLFDSIDAAFKAHRFDAVYVDNDRFMDIADRTDYVRKAGVFPDPSVFWPVSGAPSRPLRVYVPQP